MLTRRRGELVFRIGARPAYEKLFAGETATDLGPLQGDARTEEEVELLASRIADVVDELGGKVSSPAFTRESYVTHTK